MDAATKAKWVAALRSGKYKQGTGQLRTEDDCYCCLGVLCDISGVGQWVRSEHDSGEQWAYSCEGYLVTALAPDSIYYDGDCRPNRPQGSLISRNDGIASHERHTFEQIADFIEKHL